MSDNREAQAAFNALSESDRQYLETTAKAFVDTNLFRIVEGIETALAFNKVGADADRRDLAKLAVSRYLKTLP